MQIIKAKSKAQLAEILGLQRRTMMRWINSNKKLYKALKKLGYTKHRKLLDATMCTLILQQYSKTKGLNIDEIIESP